MSDSVAYILITGLVAIPAMIILVTSERMIEIVYENQSLLYSSPFF